MCDFLTLQYLPMNNTVWIIWITYICTKICIFLIKRKKQLEGRKANAEPKTNIRPESSWCAF